MALLADGWHMATHPAPAGTPPLNGAGEKGQPGPTKAPPWPQARGTPGETARGKNNLPNEVGTDRRAGPPTRCFLFY